MRFKKKWWKSPKPGIGDLIKVRPYSKIRKGFGENVGLVIAAADTKYVVMWFHDWEKGFDESSIWNFKRYEIKIVQQAERNK